MSRYFFASSLEEIQKSFYTPQSNVILGSRMVCEFLPTDYKKVLITIATIDDLIEAGYSKAGAYKAKEPHALYLLEFELILRISRHLSSSFSLMYAIVLLTILLITIPGKLALKR